MSEQVNHPTHYNTGKIEVIEFIEDQFKGIDFHLANALKYIARAGKKDRDKTIQDLEKSVWYVKRAIEVLKSQQENRDPLRPNDMNTRTVSAPGSQRAPADNSIPRESLTQLLRPAFSDEDLKTYDDKKLSTARQHCASGSNDMPGLANVHTDVESSRRSNSHAEHESIKYTLPASSRHTYQKRLTYCYRACAGMNTLEILKNDLDLDERVAYLINDGGYSETDNVYQDRVILKKDVQVGTPIKITLMKASDVNVNGVIKKYDQAFVIGNLSGYAIDYAAIVISRGKIYYLNDDNSIKKTITIGG